MQVVSLCSWVGFSSFLSGILSGPLPCLQEGGTSHCPHGGSLGGLSWHLPKAPPGKRSKGLWTHLGRDPSDVLGRFSNTTC